MTDAAAVCVLIPVFNDQAGIAKTLGAIAGDAVPYDVVVVDDGSLEPVRCGARYGCHSVTLLRLEENRGIEHALNTGLNFILSRNYRYVARLDADDVPFQDRIGRQVEFLERHPNVGIVGTWARCVDDDGNYLYTLRLPADNDAILRKQRYLPALLHPTVMIRADVFREVGLYSERYKTAEDYDLFVRISRKYHMANIPEVLTKYVVSKKGTTTAKRRKTLVSRLRVQLDTFGWRDPHSYLGVARTLLFMGIPYQALIGLKSYLWK